MNNKMKIAGIFVSLVALLAFAGATISFAQSEDDPEETIPAPEENEELLPFGPGPRGFRGHHGGRALGNAIVDPDEMKATIAEALGISVEDLETAHEEGQTLRDLAEEQEVDLDDVHAAVLDLLTESVEQAVDNELITQEEGDWILARAALKRYIDRRELMAGALGITVDELEAARQDGVTIAELAEAEGLDLDEVQANLEAGYEEAIGQAVADGVISQAQADEFMSRPGLGFGGHGGPCLGEPGQGHGPRRGMGGNGAAFENGAAFGNGAAFRNGPIGSLANA